MLMTIDTGGDDALEHAAIRTMLSHRVRGVIYAAMYHREVEIPAAALTTRAVCLNAKERENRVPSVTPDEGRRRIRGDEGPARCRAHPHCDDQHP